MNPIPRGLDPTLLAEVAVSVRVATVFRLYEHRQQWYDWSGDNMPTNTDIGIHPTLGRAEDQAERLRKSGSSFGIDELPCVVVITRSSALILGELFTNHPFRRVESAIDSMCGIRVSDLYEATRTVKNRFCPIWLKSTALEPLRSEFFSRSSSAGRGQNSLAWSLKPKDFDLSHIHAVASRIEARIAHNAVQASNGVP
jgi:hypothetical protein